MALNENRLDVAERLLKPHLKEDPFDAAAIRMLAELAARIGRWRDAENLLRRAVEIAPGWTAAKANLALVLGRTGRPAEAMELLDDIFAVEPEDIGHWNLKAATLGRLGDFEEAIRLYESVLERTPNQPRVWLSYGHMLKTVGRQEEGVAAYRKALAIQPQLGRGLVEPRESQDGQVRRGRHRSDGGRPEVAGLTRRRPLPPRLRAGQGDARCGPRGRGLRALCESQRTAAESAALSAGEITTDRGPLHRRVHR